MLVRRIAFPADTVDGDGGAWFPMYGTNLIYLQRNHASL